MLILLAVAGTAVAALVVPMRAVACSPTRQAIAPWSAELSRFTAYTVAPKRANPPANLRT